MTYILHATYKLVENLEQYFKTGATQYHTQLGLPEKGHAIKGLVVCNDWDLEPLDRLNSLALGC